MNAALRSAADQAITASTGEAAVIVSSRSVGGGCINDAQHVQLADGRNYFLKSNSARLAVMFEREAEGLQALGECGAIRIPQPIANGTTTDGQLSFLVLEWIQAGRARADSSRQFGRELARLHRQATAPRFGFSHDNFLGSTPQVNDWSADWCEFWSEFRLGYQFRLAAENGHADAEFRRLSQHVLAATQTLIEEPIEPPALLHGDLWGGNYLYDEQGAAVLIDPAVYYGRREAELGMTRLFGGFDSQFYAGYEEIWPLAPGAETRISFYQLYHVLNHLNLFGASYRSQSLALMRRFAG